MRVLTARSTFESLARDFPKNILHNAHGKFNTHFSSLLHTLEGTHELASMSFESGNINHNQ
jgi:hypothetical protein